MIEWFGKENCKAVWEGNGVWI